MNILISGNVKSLTATFTKKFLNEGHRVIIAGDEIDSSLPKTRNVITHKIPSHGELFYDALSSYNFDVIIYFSTREEQLLVGKEQDSGLQLEGLNSVLELCREEKIIKFFYISSTEIYGTAEDRSEASTALPASINGYAIFAGEQFCDLYRDKYGIDVSIIRIPFVYASDEKNTLIYNIIEQSNLNSEVKLPGSEDSVCNFLHCEDIADLVFRVIDDVERHESDVINLSSTNDLTFGDLAQLLGNQFPSVTYRFDDENLIYTKPVEVSTAKTIYGWTDIYEIRDEIAEISALVRLEDTKKDSKETKFPLEAIYKWLELILGAAAMQFLTNVTGTFIQFKYVDFRLLFVVIMGSVWGLRFGIYAFILASLSVIFNWYQLDLEWELLTQNIGNWIPFVIYFSGGAISGVMRDRKETEITAEKEQTQLIYNKYEFLFEVFNEIRNLKDEYREQLVGYRDSFGKIFSVTRELDSLQEDEIFLSAIPVFQNIMENNTIAIYSVSNGKYCRLEACSPELYNVLSSSLILTEYSELFEIVKEGRVFQNKEMLDNFPAYASPIMSGSEVLALVVIWEADFDQLSMYYLNLLRIISGLTQDSLVRALKFMDLNAGQIYVESTKILQPKPFREVIEVKAQMQRNQIADYQVIKINVEGSDLGTADLYTKVEEQIRDTDTIGMLEDGNFYVLLAQAKENTVVDISKRLMRNGIQSEIIDKENIF